MFVFVRGACSLSRNNNLHSLSDTAPFFINLQRTVVIFDDEPVAANIYKVKYYNGDTRDVLTWPFTIVSLLQWLFANTKRALPSALVHRRF
jgi:hypothetical protein